MTNANFSKRERAAIAIATLTFIGISALTHLAIGGFIESHMPHWAMQAPDQTPRPIDVTTLATPTPMPTPTPRLTPTPAPRVARATPQARSSAPPRAIVTPPPHGESTPQPGSTNPGDTHPDSTATPGTGASATPTDTSTALPSDGTPKRATDATFRHKVVPEYSSVCVDEGAGGTVTIEVTIDADGSLAAAWVGQTSGFPCLDAAALSAAKESTYNAPEVGGRPVAETYLILYEFSIDS